MSTPVDFEAGLTVGVVEAVSPDSLDVRVLTESPHGTALNSGAIQPFPTINGHVAVPTEAGAILGIVSWIGIDKDRTPTTEPDTISMPVPRRRMRVVPLGVLHLEPGDRIVLSRGVAAFPTVGDPVRLLTVAEHAAVHRTPGDGGIRIGTSLTGVPGAVEPDPNRLFGRHLAILGNTGSGKSCSVVHLIREAARSAGPDGAFRCVILDANGEFSDSFADLGVPVRHLSAASDGISDQLRVPGWMWSTEDWRAALGASGGAQLPYLRTALRLLRAFAAGDSPEQHRLLSVSVSALNLAVRRHSLATEEPQFPQRQDAGELIVALRSTLSPHAGSTEFPDAVTDAVDSIVALCNQLDADYHPGYWSFVPQEHWVALSGWCHSILEELQPEGLPNVHEDDPIACDVSLLRRLIEEVAAAEGQRAASWAAPLLFRFDALLGDPRIRQIAFDQSLGETLEEFLDQLMPNRGIVIVDLSLVPASVVHVVVGVIARIIFESHERARRHGLAPVPTLLVAEEAHTFITRRARRDDDLPPLPVDVCRTAFERIAREGRKHGVSLVVTSQRPSELSETVLSQCNTFLVHRVVNDVDQNLIRRLTPDAISGLLDELPSLPARSAFLLGWAVPVPVLVKMEEVPPEYRPHSEDPDLRAAWSSEPTANWTEVASEWATTTGPSDESVGADDEAPW